MEDRLQRVHPSYAPSHRSLSPPTKDTSPIPELFANAAMPQLSDSQQYMQQTFGRDDFETIESDETDRSSEASNSDETVGRPRIACNMRSIECSNNDMVNEEDEHDATELEIQNSVDMDTEEDENAANPDIPFEDLICDEHEAILNEAISRYQTSGKPPFCISISGVTNRDVTEVATGRTIQISFEEFNEQGWGYWEYMNNIGKKYILKYDRGKYFQWLGEEEGFARNAFAIPVSGNGSVTRRSFSINSENQYEEEHVQSPGKSLRARTSRQMRPFTIDRTKHRLAKKGLPHDDSDVEQEILSTQAKRKSKPADKHEHEPPKKKPKHRVSSLTPASTSSARSSSMTPSTTISDEMIFTHTTLRTRFHEVKDASIPVFLKKGGLADLLAEIRDGWKFKLGHRSLSYCIVSFPWLSKSANILLQESNNDGYKKLVEEIQRAPVWDQGRCEVDVDIITE